MAIPIGSRLKKAWNAFLNKEQEDASYEYKDYGSSYFYRPDRFRLGYRHERTIINAVINRIALDCASIDIKHVKLDENGRYLEDVDSGLNKCLSVEANLDQTGRAFRNDIFLSLLDKGTICIVPFETDKDPNFYDEYDILGMRVGQIIEWYPEHVKVRLYDQRDGQKKEIQLPKRNVAIVENPFYATMNDENSTLQRLVRKLNLLDVIDEQSGSGKLDLIIQLPYVVKSEKRQKEAENRRDGIAAQLKDSQYGIAYIDGTEKITQLNRPVENNLLKQIEYLTNLMFSQLGLTEEILNGSASPSVMQNYFSRIVEHIVAAPVDEFNRKFLSDESRNNKEAVKYFRDPFKLIPVENVAEIADKFTRNEIMTSNEIRQIVGMKPSRDPEADKLRNKNLSKPAGEDTSVPEEDLDSRISKLIKKKGADQNG
jgi:hypothetical protein